jgi:hypothetical protein
MGTSKVNAVEKYVNTKKKMQKKISVAEATARLQSVFTWRGDTVLPEEWIEKVTEALINPINTMRELDGDMYVSDYNKIIGILYELEKANTAIKKERCDD